MKADRAAENWLFQRILELKESNVKLVAERTVAEKER